MTICVCGAACSLVSFLLCCYDLFCRQLACFCCWSWSSFLALEVVFRTTPVPLWPQFCLLVLWQLLTLCSSFGAQFCLRPIFPSSGTSDPSSCVDSCRVCSGYVLCSGLDLAPAPVNLVSHKASGLCGGAWPHTLPSSAFLIMLMVGSLPTVRCLTWATPATSPLSCK